MSEFYDKEGRPLPGPLEWAKLAEDLLYKRVDFTEVPPDTHVSTVWLGIDHSFGHGPLLIFETMVFGGPLDQEMDRYSTEEEARVGHEAMVYRVLALKETE